MFVNEFPRASSTRMDPCILPIIKFIEFRRLRSRHSVGVKRVSLTPTVFIQSIHRLLVGGNQ
jgi:hypothetical protein